MTCKWVPLLLFVAASLGCERAPTARGSVAPAARGSSAAVSRFQASTQRRKGSVAACANVPIAPDDHGDGSVDATPLALGQSVQGTLNGSGDADWFAVSLAPGRAVRVSLHTVAPLGLAVLGPDGRTPVATAAAGSKTLDVTAAVPGLHYVRVNPGDGATAGVYVVEAAPLQ